MNGMAWKAKFRRLEEWMVSRPPASPAAQRRRVWTMLVLNLVLIVLALPFAIYRNDLSVPAGVPLGILIAIGIVAMLFRGRP
jgi:hypothetical protein